jgi:hypothetical protein
MRRNASVPGLTLHHFRIAFGTIQKLHIGAFASQARGDPLSIAAGSVYQNINRQPAICSADHCLFDPQNGQRV